MFCKNCGNQMPDDMKFCAECGTPVAPQEQKKEWVTGTPPNKTEQKVKKAPPKEYWQSNPSMGSASMQTNAVDGAADDGMQDISSYSPYGSANAGFYGSTSGSAAYGAVNTQPDPVVPKSSGSNVSGEPPRKNGNLAVKIIVIALVIAILAGITTIGIIGFVDKSEVEKTATEYIDEFPKIKGETILAVYDEEKFPVDTYEITVERYLLSGALSDVVTFRESTPVVEEITNDKYYKLNLEDGSYRITLQGVKNDPTQSGYSDETGEVITIVLEVEVDNEDPEALGSVNLRGEPVDEEDTYTDIPSDNEPDEAPQTPDMLVATQSDFNELEEMLNATIGYWSDYSPEFDYRTATTEAVVDSVIYGNEGKGYEYFFDTEVKYDEIVGYDQALYAKLPLENIKWICENIYHISFNESFRSDNAFVQGDYCYVKNPASGDGCTTVYEISGNEIVANKYEVAVDVFTDSIAMGRSKEDYGLKVTAGLQEIDGEQYWTIYSIEKTGSQSTPINGQPSVQNQKPEIEATESDFNNLADILLALNFTEYDSASATTSYAVEYMITDEVASWGYDYFYSDIVRNPTNSDPLNRFGTNYRVMSAPSVEWICENVLNIDYKSDYNSTKSYVYNGNIYRKSLNTSETVNYISTLTSYKVVNGKYEVTGEYYSAPIGHTKIDGSATLIGTYTITAELKMIDGNEQWSIYSIKRQ